MTVRVYRWDDASAPVLSAAAGSLPALLKACLVTGYGAKAAAGWSNPFSGTNVEVFRNGSGSSQLYFRVSHTGTAITAQRIVGYETMTDANTGTNPFPTEVQFSGGLYMPVSVSADSTARPWLLVATEKAFHLWVGQDRTTAQGLASTSYEYMYFVGDIRSFKAGDAFPALIIAGYSSAGYGHHGTSVTSRANTSPGQYLARAHSQAVGAVAAGKIVNAALMPSGNSIGATAGALTYPDPITGGMTLSEILVCEASGVRGAVPGILAPMHSLPGSPGDTFSGRGTLSGKTFLLLDSQADGSRARVALETSDTW